MVFSQPPPQLPHPSLPCPGSHTASPRPGGGWQSSKEARAALCIQMAVLLTSPKEGDLSGGRVSEPDTAALETWLWEGSSYDLEWELPLLKVSK